MKFYSAKKKESGSIILLVRDISLIEPTKSIIGPWLCEILIKRVILSAENGWTHEESLLWYWQSLLNTHEGCFITLRASIHAPFYRKKNLKFQIIDNYIYLIRMLFWMIEKTIIFL